MPFARGQARKLAHVTSAAGAKLGLATAIPGGLGVIEAVYLALLSGSVRQGTLMGAVLAYRALYYLLPLAGGLVLYAWLERYASAHTDAQ